MKVLGVDPGMANTGWAVLLQENTGREIRLLDCGLIKTEAGLPLAQRLERLHRVLSGVFKSHSPDVMALEEVFFLKASRSVAATCQARGAILLAAAQRGCPVSEYNPREVKSTLTGNGSALKPQMQKMIQNILRLPELPRPDDVADAMAIALCHLRAGRLKQRIVNSEFKVLQRFPA